MGSEENRSSHSRSRCRSPEDGAEGESKRRKHRHHRHRHRHRHHRSGHGRERREGEVLDIEPEAASGPAAPERLDDYEREEGEIFEEEDGVGPESRDLVQGNEGIAKERRRGDVDENDSSGSRSRSQGSGESLHGKKRKGGHGDEVLPAKLGKLSLCRSSDSPDAGRKSSDRDDRPGTSRDRHREQSRSNERERRNGSEHENGRAIDKIRASERKDDRERESSIHSRHEEQGNSRGGRERDREQERHHRRSSLDRVSLEVGKHGRGERERSISHSRYDTRGDRHDSRGREHERERGKRSRSSLDRDEERRRDMSRERYRERESARERDRDGSDRDKMRLRDRETLRHNDREWGRHCSRDRHRDSRHSRYDELESRNERTKSKELVREASSPRHPTGELKGKPVREEDEEDYQEKIEQQLAKQDEEDVEKIKEESRKRRLAILEKYKQKQLGQHTEAQSNNHEKEDTPSTASPEKDRAHDSSDNVASGQVPIEGLESKHDPSDLYIAETSFALGKSPVQNGKHAVENSAVAHGLGEGTPKSERSEDMFCDDIFGESPTGVRKLGKVDGIQIERSGLLDNWDDAEGYYSYRFGEVLDGRYEVIAGHGKGVFSTVVRAKDLKAGKGDPEEVAIKIIRNNETMYKAGLEELTILKKLAGADPDDRRHCVRFISNFKYRNHLCLVFESLHMNLREVLKKFGRNIGLKLTAVRAYAKQLFIALKHLRNCGVLHCDIKPDNMLVNEAKNVLKLCDFGNAMFAGKNEITPYLVSRFYRAPEIILGLSYDHPMDIWSVGCCLYELYSGKVLFPGPSNNDMLRLHMELKGPFPKKMLRKGAFTEQHFDQDLNFHATEEDPVTKKTVKRLLLNIKPKDIGMLISGSPGEDPKMLANFKDLLERIFVLDPEKRMTVSQALSHPFITGK